MAKEIRHWERDHTVSTVQMHGEKVSILCSCGWRSGLVGSVDEARKKHSHLREKARELELENFAKIPKEELEQAAKLGQEHEARVEHRRELMRRAHEHRQG
jgi:hypothetical protein